MTLQSPSIEILAQPSRLAEARRFVSDQVPHQAERLRLLVSELVTLMVGVASRLTVTVIERDDSVEVRVVPDAVSDGGSLEPDPFVRKVIEALSETFTIHVGNDEIYLSAVVPTGPQPA